MDNKAREDCTTDFRGSLATDRHAARTRQNKAAYPALALTAYARPEDRMNLAAKVEIVAMRGCTRRRFRGRGLIEAVKQPGRGSLLADRTASTDVSFSTPTSLP